MTGVTGGVLPGARPRSRIRTFRRMEDDVGIGGVRQFEVRGMPPLCVFCGLCEPAPIGHEPARRSAFPYHRGLMATGEQVIQTLALTDRPLLDIDRVAEPF